MVLIHFIQIAANKHRCFKQHRFVDMKYTGVKIGLVFFAISVICTLTLLPPVLLLEFVESFGSTINDIFNLGNVSGTCFYLGAGMVMVSSILFFVALWRSKDDMTGQLVLLFLVLLVFLNAAIVYYDIRLPDAHIDGQQAFHIIPQPLATSWIYPLIGLIHDAWLARQHRAAMRP